MMIVRHLEPKDLAQLLLSAAETYARGKSAKANSLPPQAAPMRAEACSHARQVSADTDWSGYD